MKQKVLTGLLLAVFIVLAVASQAVVRTGAQERGSSVKKTVINGEFVPGEVIVRFREGAATAKTKVPQLTVLRTSEREISAEIKEFEGSEIVSNLRIAYVAPEDTLLAIEALNQREDVLYAEPNYIRRKHALPNDPRFAEMWGLKNTGQLGGTVGADIDAELAWNITTGNRSVVVGVVDEGIDINHPDLVDNIWRNPGETAGNSMDDDGNGFVDDINGWDFYHNDASVYDGAAGNNTTDSHGTHVAGTIGATGNNGVGITGVNWQVSIMSLKILGSSATDPAAPSNVSRSIRAYSYARMMRQRGINLRVLNNSYGGGGKSQSELDAILALNEVGILFVASAGNDGLDSGGFPHFPSNYDAPNLIAVAATNRFDNISSFSTFGARTVSIGAPGSEIASTTPNNTYRNFSGTSMASPQVSGVAALILSVNPNISAQNLRGVLAYSGDVLPALQGKTTTGRRLNAYNALLSQAENDTTAPAPVNDLRITGQNGRAVTFAWTAVGDDGNSGQAADYDFVFTNSTTGLVNVTPASLSTLLPRTAGAQETASVSVPYRNFAGTVELRVYDNAGNVSRTSINVTVSVNAGSDPYEIALSAPTALTTGGTALGLLADDKYREDYALPFPFPFFGQNRSTVTISTNGSLYFSKPIPKRPNGDADDVPSSVEGLNGAAMIAGLWDDLQTDIRTGDDVYVTTNANSVIFRWQAVTFGTQLPVNFEIELRRDGTVQTRYGDGNTRLFPVVGISGGEPDAYVISSHTYTRTSINLTNAQTVTFTPRPATVVAAPTVTSIEPNTRTAGSAAFEIVVNGTGFVNNSVVRFNGQNRATTFVSATQLRAQISAADVSTAGAFPITVINANGDLSGAVNLTVVACAYSINPVSQSFAAAGGSGSFTVTTTDGCASTATSSAAAITVTSGTITGTGTRTISFTVGANTGAARTGTITVGGQVFTVTQEAGRTTAPRRARFDFDGDGKSDLSVFRPSNNNWYFLTNAGFSITNFGAAGDIPVAADYDGDGKTDIAVFRPSNGTWYFLTSAGFSVVNFGVSGDIPVAGDYNGDGKSDIAVFRPSNNTWYFLTSAGFSLTNFGAAGDIPVAADYDGDGKTDIAVFRPSNGTWYFLTSAGFSITNFGASGDIPVAGDYDGDGKSDIAVFRPSNGTWYFLTSAGFSLTTFGASGDIPVAADYNGDGKTDIAVFRPSNGNWYLLTSAGFSITNFGANGDIPVSRALVP